MNTNKIKAIFQIVLIVLTSFTVYLISAEPVKAIGCCEKIGDQYCQPPTLTTSCTGDTWNPNVLSCSDTTFCKLGTCFIDGVCSSNVPKAQCESQDGQWFDKPMNSVQECSQGCCVKGSQCLLTTQSQCSEFGSDDFRSNIVDTNSCTYECIREDKGCCVTEQSCTFSTRDQCNNLNGNFNSGQYCSKLNECSDCTSHNHLACGITDKVNVYWFDSCNNQEEIADSCNYPQEMCATDIKDQDNDGNKEEYLCRDLTCKNVWDNPLMDDMKTDRLNGESWCSYESATGPGKDLPGSQHYYHECVNGEEIAYPCDDYRSEICIYTEVKDPDSDLSMGLATCKENLWQDCSLISNKKNCQNPENGDCVWVGDRCVPLYPPGFSKNEGKLYCSAGNIVTQVAWEKEVGKDWKIKENEDALKDKFLKDTNSLCNMYGDCGADYNIDCKFSWKGFRRNCGETHGEDCLKYLDKSLFGGCNKFTYAGVGNYIEYFEDGQDFISKLMNPSSDFGMTSDFLIDFPTALGILGTSITSLSALGLYEAATTSATFLQTNQISFLNNLFQSVIPNQLVGDIGFRQGTSNALQILSNMGSGGVALASQIFAAVTIVVTVYLIVQLTLELLKKNDVTEVSTVCKQWQAPRGSESCEKCQLPMSSGGLLPDKDGKVIPGYECTKYMCESLGTGCKFVDDSAEGAVCVPISEEDQKSPIIKPDYTSLSVSCSSGNCNINENGIYGYEINGEISEYTKIVFGIKTVNEFGDPLLSNCYYNDLFDVENPSYPYELTAGDSAYSHKLELFNLKDGEEYNYHIMCENAVSGVESIVDYVIKFKIHQGPDLTPPVIEAFKPVNNGYVASTASQNNIEISVNELVDLKSSGAGCKWSTENVNFDQMENWMVCPTPSSNENMQKCIDTLPNINVGQNIYYLSCKDNAGNVNTPVQYTITRTNELKIDSINTISDKCSVDNTGLTRCFSNSVDLEVKTSEGAESGKSICYYSNICDSERCMQDKFFNSDSSLHSQPGLVLYGGLNKFYVRCTDAANNIATGSIEVYSDVDNYAPILTKIVNDKTYNKLKIKVYDSSEVTCKYSDVYFSFDEAGISEMEKIGDEFYAPIGLDTYYIRCRDSYNNEMPLQIIHL